MLDGIDRESIRPRQFSDDWKYVAMVLDRILLWMFTVACVIGERSVYCTY